VSAVDLGIWRNLTKLVVGLVVLAIVLLIIMYYRPLIAENERMRRDILKLEDQIRAQEKISEDYSNQIVILTTDPKTVERLAREKLGYARPDETVIHFESSPTNR
jgi:cell division protein FtsB